MPTIQIENLRKNYGKHIGIRDISFSVQPGEIFGFVGPNGAGKSTTIKLLLGFIFADSGSASICGLDIATQSRQIKAFTGYVPSEVHLYSGMTVGELLRRSAGFYRTDCRPEMQRLCELFGVDTKKRFRELSGGNKKKVSIICALMAGQKVIILDEPTNGLDPLMQKLLFQELAGRAAHGAAVLLSSHNLTEVQEYCHRVAFIRDGAILTVTDLTTEIERTKIITVTGAAADIPLGFELLATEGDRRTFRTILNGKDLLRAVNTLALRDITIENESIEDRFWSLYGKEVRNEHS